MIDREKFKELVEKQSEKHQRLTTLNRDLGIRLGILGILLSLGAAVSGIIFPQKAQVSAIFAACAATAQSILFAYPVDRRAAFHRLIMAKSENIFNDLEVKAMDEAQILAALEQFKAIKLEAALEEPQGGKLTEAIDLQNVNEYMDKLEKLLEEYKQIKAL